MLLLFKRTWCSVFLQQICVSDNNLGEVKAKYMGVFYGAFFISPAFFSVVHHMII